MASYGEARGDWRMTLELLRRLGCGAIVTNSHHRIVAWNSLAVPWINEWQRLLPPEVRKWIEDSAVLPCAVQWIMRKRGEPAILHMIAQSSSRERNQVLLVLITPHRSYHIDAEALSTVFRLTPAEAKLASRFARGERMHAIAAAHRISVVTARTQLSAIFAKTATEGQVELGLLLARLALVQSTGLPTQSNHPASRFGHELSSVKRRRKLNGTNNTI
jgi:DNA-binding CsgD family transcriptional regulator